MLKLRAVTGSGLAEGEGFRMGVNERQQIFQPRC